MAAAPNTIPAAPMQAASLPVTPFNPPISHKNGAVTSNMPKLSAVIIAYSSIRIWRYFRDHPLVCFFWNDVFTASSRPRPSIPNMPDVAFAGLASN
jgi:hypothetical protein